MPSAGKIISIMTECINFVFIFSIFNDNYTVGILGGNALKIITGIFIVFHSHHIWKNLMTERYLMYLIPFYIFFIADYTIMLLNPSDGGFSSLLENIMLLIAMLIIVLYYINYDLNYLTAYIWSALAFSSFLLILSDPISRWTFRRTGGTGDPNEFAAHMILFIMLSVYMSYSIRIAWLKYTAIALSALLFVNSILYAASLSSFIVCAILGLWISARYLLLSVNKIAVAGASIVLTGIILFALFSSDVREMEMTKNLVGRSKQTGTALFRINSWKAGFNMFADKPVSGVGMNSFSEYTRQYSDVYVSDDAIAPHSIYVKVLAESGALVFAAFISFLTILVVKYFGEIYHSRYFWVHSGLLGILMMGFTLGILYDKYLWLSVALLMNVHMRIDNERDLVKRYLRY